MPGQWHRDASANATDLRWGFRDLENNPIQVAQGSILSESLQYSSQLGMPPISPEGERYPWFWVHANDGSCIPWFLILDNTLGAALGVVDDGNNVQTSK